MLGFITNSHYDIKGDAPKIYLYGRLENGKSFCATTTTIPYFYISKEDEDAALSIIKLDVQQTKRTTLSGRPVTRINTKNPKEIPQIRRLLEDAGIPCFEADIRYVRRFFIDNDIQAVVDIQGKSVKGEFTDVYYDSPKLLSADPSKNNIQPTMLSFDIETDPKAKRIHSVSLYNESVKLVIVVENDAFKKYESDDVIKVKNDKELLVEFCNQVRLIDPDILVGWNCIDFDLKVMLERAKYHKIRLALGRSDTNLKLRIESNFFRDSSATLDGRLVLDGIQLMKSSFIKLDNYKLNTAAKYFLQTEKTITNDDRWEIIENYYYEEPKKFVEYNLKDSILVYDILIKSKIFSLTVKRSLITGLHMDEVKGSIAAFDSLYLRKLKKRNLVAPSTKSIESNQGLGGYVMNSQPGIYKNILVLDFKSLYPSLMRTFNIDPVSYVGQKENIVDAKDKSKFIISPNDAVFSTTEGILPSILTELWKERDKVKKDNNDIASYAIKIHMNSMYGVLASPNCRFHVRNISNAITYFAQYFIKLTSTEIQRNGYEVIYGDTDSVFVNTKTSDTKKAIEIGKDIEKKLNSYITTYIKEKYARDSVLELEYEKTFTNFFMPSVRGSDSGAKKRYAGLKLQPDGSTKIDFTGLEFVRRDWTEVSKVFQLELLNKIFADEEVDEYILSFVNDLKSGKYDELLMYRKSLRKNIEKYTKTTPPHVKAARLLDEIKNNIIEYYITVDGPQPVEKMSSKIDYEHYIDKQIKPIADSVLQLKKTSFEDVIKGSKQQGLGKFF